MLFCFLKCYFVFWNVVLFSEMLLLCANSVVFFEMLSCFTSQGHCREWLTVSQTLLFRLKFNFVKAIMVPRGWMLLTLVILWLFISHHWYLLSEMIKFVHELMSQLAIVMTTGNSLFWLSLDFSLTLKVSKLCFTIWSFAAADSEALLDDFWNSGESCCLFALLNLLGT